MCNRLQGILSRRSANKREMGEKVSRAYPKALKKGPFPKHWQSYNAKGTTNNTSNALIFAFITLPLHYKNQVYERRTTTAEDRIGRSEETLDETAEAGPRLPVTADVYDNNGYRRTPAPLRHHSRRPAQALRQ